jgi:hypothetical protein
MTDEEGAFKIPQRMEINEETKEEDVDCRYKHCDDSNAKVYSNVNIGAVSILLTIYFFKEKSDTA